MLYDMIPIFLHRPNQKMYHLFPGGTLKIYGESLRPDVPYKTLLLSISDTALYVVKETLEKYGMEKEDPNDFCLVQVRDNIKIIIKSKKKYSDKQTLKMEK